MSTISLSSLYKIENILIGVVLACLLSLIGVFVLKSVVDSTSIISSLEVVEFIRSL